MQLDTFIHSAVYNLANEIEYANGAIVSKILSKKESGNITLFSFDKEQGLSEHSAPFDAFIQVLEGTAKIFIDGKEYILKAHECIIMPANIPHSVHASERFKMLLTMIKSQ